MFYASSRRPDPRLPCYDKGGDGGDVRRKMTYSVWRDDGRMSDYDWSPYKLIFNNPGSPSMIARPGSFAITESIGRGITADPNGLSYVYDMKSGKIHVYDRSDKDSDKVQCHVNDSKGGG